MVRRSFADDSYGRAPFAWSIEFRKINALPCSQCDLAIAHRERYRVADQDRFHVCGSVSLGMRVLRIARDGAFERREHVLLHVGVRVLVDEYRGGGVRDADRHEPLPDPRARDRGLHPRRDVERLFALLRCDGDLLMSNGHAVATVSRSAMIRAIRAGVAFPPLTTRSTFRPRGSIFPARTAASGAAPEGSTSSESRSRYS